MAFSGVSEKSLVESIQTVSLLLKSFQNFEIRLHLKNKKNLTNDCLKHRLVLTSSEDNQIHVHYISYNHNINEKNLLTSR